MRPAGAPVAASCFTLRSSEETALLRNIGRAKSAKTIVARHVAAPRICLTEGILWYIAGFELLDVGFGI